MKYLAMSSFFFAAAISPMISFADSMQCYQDCIDEQTGVKPWQLLETGAQCSPGEHKYFSRSHPAPDGNVWYSAPDSEQEQFEGTSVINFSKDKKQLIVVTHCKDGQLEKHRIHAKYRLDMTPDVRDSIHKMCVKKCE